VRLRHLLSGQYLCIRPAAKNDAPVLRFESNIITNKSSESAKNLKSASNSSPKKDANQGRSMTSNIVPFENFETKTFGDVKKVEKATTIDEKRAMILEQIRKNSCIATSSFPENSGLFYIFSCNCYTSSSENLDQNSKPDKFIRFEDSVYFEHKSTSCRLKLHGIGDSQYTDIKGEYNNTDSQWFEYNRDVPLQPSDPLESSSALVSANANACKLETVDIQIVRDIMYAVRFIPLIRTGISCVQSVTKRNVLSLTAYKQVASGLCNLSEWALLKGTNESYLTENKNRISAANNRKGSFLTIGDNSVISDTSEEDNESDSNDDDDDSVPFSPARGRALTVLERMNTTEYPALLDNMNLPSNSNKRSQGSNTGQREKIDAISRESIKRRQGLLSDCRLLEMSLYFTNIVFALVRDKNPLLEDMKYQFDENTENLDIRMLESGCRNNGQKWDQNSSVSACPAPLILLDCCVLVHELVRSAVALDNKNNAMKISSIQGMYVHALVFSCNYFLVLFWYSCFSMFYTFLFEFSV
jgi:hypothetical protein